MGCENAVQPHVPKVVAEAWLHERKRYRVERFAGRSEHFVNDGRNGGIILGPGFRIPRLASER